MFSKIVRSALMALVVAAVALPVTAGDYGKKCTLSTQECLDMMAAKMKSSGWIGVELDHDETGAMSITKVIPGSPAEAAGLRVGDELYSLNGVNLAGAAEPALKQARGEWKPGQQVNYVVKRGGAEQKVNLTLAAWPADVLAKMVGEHMLEHATMDVAKN